MMQHTFEQNLSRQELQKLRNNRTGLLIFQLSWILVFVSLIVINLQIRGNNASWPPPGVAPHPVTLPIVATLALIASSAFAHHAVTALKESKLTTFLAEWPVVMALGALFVIIMAYQFVSVPPSGQYGAVFQVMIGYHGIHAIVIGLFLWRTFRVARAGLYSPVNFWGAEAAVKLWDFVTIAWLLFFVVLYVI
jgi:cytochrome c oxidase subunit 3